MAISDALTRTGGVLIARGGSGAWDEGKIGPLAIIETSSGIYRMWYEGINLAFSLSQTGYATSTDGVTWTKYGSNPILVPTEVWENNELCPGTVLYDGQAGLFKMWYHGGFNAPSHRQMGYATSPDGITWTKYAGNPVMTYNAAAWESDRVHDASVIRVSATDYRMWYVGSNGSVQAIGYATSNDGITWTKYASNPVFQSGAGGQWDDGTLFGLNVFSRAGDSTLHAWYAADDGTLADPTATGIGYASSTNGTSWTRGPSNPVLVGTVTPEEWISDPVWAYQHGNDVRVVYYYDDFGPNPADREHRMAIVTSAPPLSQTRPFRQTRRARGGSW